MTTVLRDAFPSYLEVPRRVPVIVWRIGSAVAVAGAVAVVVLCFVAPETGLKLWWLYLLPTLPLLLVLAPGIWRNLCPMAALNQTPRLLGFTRGLTVPGWLRRNAFALQAVFYFALITMRAPLFDHNGRAVGVLLLTALGAAFVGGVVFKGKSGWCGTFCPLLPIQRLYGQAPAVVVPNAHCRPCVGCTKNCYDFNPRLAMLADAYDDDDRHVAQRRLFAGMFPGFVVAFLVIPEAPIAEGPDIGIATAEFFALVVGAMLLSLGVYHVVDSLTDLSPVVLMAAFGALGLNAHNVLSFPGAFELTKPAWLLAIEYSLVGAVTIWFVVRVHRQELLATEASRRPRGFRVRPSRAAQQAAKPLEETVEVEFEGGPRVVAARGTALLDVAEGAELPIEPGCRMGVCGADPVSVSGAADALTAPDAGELATLRRLGLDGSCRMACVARVQGDVRVSLDVSSASEAAPGERRPAAAGAHDPGIQRVVVIGNGIAGVTAAEHARRQHPNCSIQIIADELHPLYNRMGISRLVYGRSAMAGLELLPERWYAEHDVSCWLNTQALAIDLRERVVHVGTGETAPYDRLVLAMGAAAALPPIDGVRRDGVFVVRRADDAMALRAFAQRRRARRAAVIGGGLLGLEAAYALHRLGIRVTVFQRGQRLLSGQLDERGSDLVSRYFHGLGIEVALGESPVEVEGNGQPAGVALADGRRVHADLVVVCAGIGPNTALAREVGITVARGVVVDERMRTSADGVLAAGDVAEFDGRVHGLWPVAVEQGEVAGVNAVGGDRTYAAKPPVATLKGVGLAVQSIGVVQEQAGDEVIVEDAGEAEMKYRKLVTRDGRAVGAVLLGSWQDAPAVLAAVQARSSRDELVRAAGVAVTA